MLRALRAPHAGEEEPVYPGTCRPRTGYRFQVEGGGLEKSEGAKKRSEERVNWRFQVPDGEVISFVDGYYGRQEFEAGEISAIS